MTEYVNKKELLDSLEKKIKESNEYGMAVVDSDFIDLVNDATEVEDVTPVVHGEWEFISLDGSLWCSRCKRPSGYGRKAENKYCRNCGAKMDGEME